MFTEPQMWAAQKLRAVNEARTFCAGRKSPSAARTSELS
jgi:hypothetical protein